LDSFSNMWLARAEDLTLPSSQPSAPVVWFNFDESGQVNTVVDTGTGDANQYTGTVVNWSTLNWKPGEGRNGSGCIYFPAGNNSYVDVNVAALGFMGDATHDTAGGGGVSFSVWVNASLTEPTMRTSWNGLFGVWDQPVAIETLEIHCPSPTIPTNVNFIKRAPGDGATASTSLTEDNFTGKWNHFAFTKSELNGGELKVYCNSHLVADQNATDDPQAYGPLFSKWVGGFRIGIRGGNWGSWSGRQDDFQVYDYCLSQEEINYLATDGTGHIFIPLVTEANLKSSGNPTTEIVDFKDLSVMRDQWHTMVLWP